MIGKDWNLEGSGRRSRGSCREIGEILQATAFSLDWIPVLVGIAGRVAVRDTASAVALHRIDEFGDLHGRHSQGAAKFYPVFPLK